MTALFLLLSVIALVFKVFPPKKINYLYGYRTSSSMKNIENWHVANQYASTIMLISMLSLLLVSYVLDVLAIDGKYLLLSLLILSIALMIFLTEKKIKRFEATK
jgi:uncharacterized membrane protein